MSAKPVNTKKQKYIHDCELLFFYRYLVGQDRPDLIIHASVSLLFSTQFLLNIWKAHPATSEEAGSHSL